MSPPKKTGKPAPEPFKPELWWACAHCGAFHGEMENPPEECDYCGKPDDFDSVADRVKAGKFKLV